MPLHLARMLAESLAVQLATCPRQLCDDAEHEGMHPRLLAGLRAARDAFAEHVGKNDAEELLSTMRKEVKKNLLDLSLMTDYPREK